MPHCIQLAARGPDQSPAGQSEQIAVDAGGEDVPATQDSQVPFKVNPYPA